MIGEHAPDAHGTPAPPTSASTESRPAESHHARVLPDTTVFRYTALRRDGTHDGGTVEAKGREAAAQQLGARGLFVVSLIEASGAAASAGGRAGMGRLSMSELAVGLRALATLLEAGLPIARALHTFASLAPDGWREALPSVEAAVREGKSLAQALACAPLRMPPVVLGILQAGEAGSGLSAAVRRAADLSERQAARVAALRQALAYPALLLSAGLASVCLLVGVVLPRFAALLADLGQTMPPTTRLVLSAAHALRTGAVPVLVWGTVGVIGWNAWVQTLTGRRQWHAQLLAMPIIGAIRRAAVTGRWCAALAALLECGVPVAPALAHAARACGDAAVAQRLLAARARIVTGSPIARALDAERAVTPAARDLIRVGEESGRLAMMLAHAARLEEDRAESALRTFVQLVEPALVLLFGGLIALVAAALLQAVYAVRPVG